MHKSTTIWLIVGGGLILLGGVLFFCVMMMTQGDFSQLSTNRYQTVTHDITIDFTDITMDIDTTDVIILPSSDETVCSVVCVEAQNTPHTVSVKDEVLKVEMMDNRKWYEHIGINFKNTSVTIYLPKDMYQNLTINSHTGKIQLSQDIGFERVDITQTTGDVTCSASNLGDVSIATSTGYIQMQGAELQSLKLSTTTGKISLTDIHCQGVISLKVTTGKTHLSGIRCQNLHATGSTGDITLQDVIATGEFSIERKTGDVKFEACDATDIFVETDTGSVKGSLLSEKIFITQTDTGRVDVPTSLTGGKCEINTDTGDIHITLS